MADDKFARTLTGLRSFRRNYDYWERVIAEFALAKQGLTQREVARMLGGFNGDDQPMGTASRDHR